MVFGGKAALTAPPTSLGMWQTRPDVWAWLIVEIDASKKTAEANAENLLPFMLVTPFL